MTTMNVNTPRTSAETEAILAMLPAQAETASDAVANGWIARMDDGTYSVLTTIAGELGWVEGFTTANMAWEFGLKHRTN